MFSGFWGWFFVVVIVAAIFGASSLPELKKMAEDKFKIVMNILQKGKKEIEAKMHEAKKHKAEEKQEKIEHKSEE